MAFLPLSAKNAKVRVGAGGGAVFTAKKWRVTPKTGMADTTNFEGNGYGEGIGTIIEADIEITEADWDGNANPYDGPPSPDLQPGNIVEVTLYISGTGGPSWSFPTALVLEAPNDADVRGTVKISAKLYGNGEFTYPTGDASPQ